MTTEPTTTVPQVGPRITKEHIDDLLSRSDWSDIKIGNKTTVVCLTLPNGFEVIESSGCVDPTNYDHVLGVEICKKRIIDQVWKLEGYALAHDLAKPVPATEVVSGTGIGGLGFGSAIQALKDGRKVARAGWNGKGMWLVLQVPDAHSKMTLPYIYIEYPVDHPAYQNGSRVPWLASQTDALAEDWVVLTD